MVQPDFREFSRLARGHTLIPVVKSVTADLLTPVSAFLAVAEKEPYAFLLESVERGEQIGRYTFLGARPYMQVSAREDQVLITTHKHTEETSGGALRTAKKVLRAHKPATIAGLPPFTAGAVGYFGYDLIRQLEKIGNRAKADLKLPDSVLMFFDRLLAFDHLRHQIHIIASADVREESPRKAYARALHDIEALEKKLSTGLRPAHWQTNAGSGRHKMRIQAGISRQRFMQAV